MRAFLLAAVLLASCTTTFSARNAKIRWILPDTYTNQEPLVKQDISAINVYGTEPRRLIVARPGVSTSYTVTGLTLGEHCFFTTAVVGTVESDDSEVVCKLIR